jgi:hypothetical protein
MAHTQRASKRKGRKEVVPVVGLVGVSLSLAGGASAATAVPAADVPSWNTSPITLNEEEIADVSLATFYVFDKENAGTPRLGEKLAQGCRGCRGGCRGCGRGCRGCGGGGCGGCRGCGGCGSCCLSWGCGCNLC